MQLFLSLFHPFYTRKTYEKNVTWHDVKAKSYVPRCVQHQLAETYFTIDTIPAPKIALVSLTYWSLCVWTKVPSHRFILDPLIFKCPCLKGSQSQHSWISIWWIGNVISVTYLMDVSRYLYEVITMTRIYFLCAEAYLLTYFFADNNGFVIL